MGAEPMDRPIRAHYDGKVIVPDEPIDLPVGQKLQVLVTVESAAEPPPAGPSPPAEPAAEKFAWLLDFAVDVPDAPPDLAAQHDHYLYGTPKR
jgi:hypothetical protein